MSEPIKIEWELEPILNEMDDGSIKKRVWQTSCQKLRLTQVMRQDKLVATAEMETEQGYKQAEKNPLGVGYVTYYTTLRLAAEAAERVLSNKSAKTSNIEDMLLAAASWQGEVIIAHKTKGDEDMANATANEVFSIKESSVRKLVVDLGMDVKGKGAKIPSLEKMFNSLDRWVTPDMEAKLGEGESLNLFRAMGSAFEDGEVIKIIPDEEGENGDEVQGKENTNQQGESAQHSEGNVDVQPVHAEEKETRESCPWKVKSEKLVKLTPALVKRFHEMKVFPRDRSLKKNILAVLDEAFRIKEYRGGELASVFVHDLNEEFRVNGKHTCETATIWQAAGNDLPDVKMTVREYECDTMEQAVDLYRTFDPAVSGRSKGDIIQCYASARESLEGVENAMLKLVTPAIAYATWGTSYKKYSTEQQTHLMIENSDFVVWLSEIMKARADAKHLWRLPVVVAMYKTWQVNRDVAAEFWKDVKFTSEDHELPSQKLRKWLEKTTFGATEKPGKASDREGVWNCLHAWNAFRDESHQYPPKKKYTSEVGYPDLI